MMWFQLLPIIARNLSARNAVQERAAFFRSRPETLQED